MGAGKIGGAAHDLVDVFFPVARAGVRRKPPVRTSRADAVRRPTEISAGGDLGDNAGDEHLAVTAFRPEIEASVAGAGTAAGLDFQDILAVIGCRGILLPGNGHHTVLGVVVNHDTVVSVPESRVAVEHLPERHGRSEFLRRRDARSPLGGYGCGKGNRAGGIP